MIDNYIIKNMIGSGTFGDIFLGYDKINKCDVAIKKIVLIDFKESKINMILTEIKIGYYNNCEYLVKIKDFFVYDHAVYLIMNYYDQSDLRKLKKDKLVNKNNRNQIVYNILRGIQYLHVNKIIHRDIKLANIMVKNNIAYVGDFGTCRILPENKYFANTCIGTPYYLSPEIIGGDKYNVKVDIYSLGCILCELYYDKRPYNANNIYALYKNVLESQKSITINTKTRIGKMINNMIDKDSYNRPIIDEVISIYNLEYKKDNKIYKKDIDFYNKTRRYISIPKDINELKITLEKMKGQTLTITKRFPTIKNIKKSTKKTNKKNKRKQINLPSVL